MIGSGIVDSQIHHQTQDRLLMEGGKLCFGLWPRINFHIHDSASGSLRQNSGSLMNCPPMLRRSPGIGKCGANAQIFAFPAC